MPDLIDPPAAGIRCSVLFIGARVIDPEIQLDGQRNVGVGGDTIAYVGTGRPDADTIVDATGKVLAPGFVDLHSHAQNVTGARLQALDGVTTALELEIGSSTDVTQALEAGRDEGRAINFGYSASWGRAHMRALSGENRDFDLARDQKLDSWDTVATVEQVQAIVDELGAGRGWRPGHRGGTRLCAEQFPQRVLQRGAAGLET